MPIAEIDDLERRINPLIDHARSNLSDTLALDQLARVAAYSPYESQTPAASATIGTARLPGGRYASMHYVGPPEGISDAYATIYGEWLPNSGLRLAAEPPIEVHRPIGADQSDLENPEDHELLICVPIE